MRTSRTIAIGLRAARTGARLAALCASPGAAAVCQVPAEYPSIGEAVAVVTCDEIVLAGTVLSEDVTIERTLTLRGAGVSSSTLRGRLQIQGSAVVSVEDLTIDTDGCFGFGLQVSGDAAAPTGQADLAVIDSGGGTQCPIFRDGFETGDGGRWSASAP
jgi:hypothetical protein